MTILKEKIKGEGGLLNVPTKPKRPQTRLRLNLQGEQSGLKDEMQKEREMTMHKKWEQSWRLTFFGHEVQFKEQKADIFPKYLHTQQTRIWNALLNIKDIHTVALAHWKVFKGVAWFH